jgi:hypothetical protein
MASGLPTSAIIKPEVVNTPVPTMLAITRIVAEGSPIALLSSLLFRLFFNDHLHFSQIRCIHQKPVCDSYPAGSQQTALELFWLINDRSTTFCKRALMSLQMLSARCFLIQSITVWFSKKKPRRHFTLSRMTAFVAWFVCFYVFLLKAVSTALL